METPGQVHVLTIFCDYRHISQSQKSREKYYVDIMHDNRKAFQNNVFFVISCSFFDKRNPKIVVKMARKELCCRCKEREEARQSSLAK